MPADGLLLIGAAESIRPDHPSFEARREGGVFALRPRAPAPAPPAAPAPSPPAPDHVTDGERLAAAGDHRSAAAAFRRAAYLRPGDPLVLARLALALEALGDAPAAGRAFRAARAALARSDHSQVEPGLDGFSVAALERLLEDRS
jgi:hypothetical protein